MSGSDGNVFHFQASIIPLSEQCSVSDTGLPAAQSHSFLLACFESAKLQLITLFVYICLEGSKLSPFAPECEVNSICSVEASGILIRSSAYLSFKQTPTYSNISTSKSIQVHQQHAAAPKILFNHLGLQGDALVQGPKSILEI